MDITGEHFLPIPRPAVWAALNDLDVLKAAISRCDSLVRLSASEIEATVIAKIGPLKASFKGLITLSDIDPPKGYTMLGEGKGGIAGFAKGAAKVRLIERRGGTVLHYDVTASIGGKLAKFGSKLTDVAAKKFADEFFAKLTALAATRGGEK